MNGITKDTFAHMDVEDKLNVLFDCAIEANKNFTEYTNGVTGRVEKLEQRKTFDTIISSVSGIIAAVGAIFAKSFFWSGK